MARLFAQIGRSGVDSIKHLYRTISRDESEFLVLFFGHTIVNFKLNKIKKIFLKQKKIDKRGRKLVDYDSQRHSFQNLQANAAKRKDDVKLTKGREQLEEAKRTYELLNTELHDELPALFDSRILFLVTNLQTLFASEQMFNSEISKIYSELEAIVDKLATESQRGSYTLKKLNCKFPKKKKWLELSN